MDNNSQKGFTLLEIIIVLAITGILAFGALSSYRGFSEKQLLQGETEKFVVSLESARKRANSGQKPCTDFEGTYVVSWNNTSYTTTPSGCSSDATTYTFPNTIDFNSGSGSITYKPFGLGTTGSSSTCILVHHNKVDVCQEVTVEASGTTSFDYDASCSCP